jgi:NAD(P)-dependent dehydrogenase (short-subunit alcohol dehydrogenase family)
MKEKGSVMSDPTIIVTGASGGLGAATARILGQMGANVVLNARSEDDLNRVATDIDPEGKRVIVIAGDVSQPRLGRRLVQTALDRFQRLDGLINNAGVLQPIAPIAEAAPDDWAYNVNVNLLGPFYLTHYALAALRRRRGRVINVSSGAAVNATEGWSAYCAAKAALNHFTRVLAAEESELVALSFRPGVVDTAMQAAIRKEGAAGMPADSYRRFVQYHEEGELLPPEVPGRALAVLALSAPHPWSGDFVSWEEPRVAALLRS